MTGLPTTQQKRAKHAWDTVVAARKGYRGEKWDEFDGHVKSIGPRIVIAGLGPAMAFVAAKAKDGSDFLLLKHLSEWLLRNVDPQATYRILQQKIMSGTSDELRRWTAEALEWLVWVKRFCEAEERQMETTERQRGAAQ